MTTAMDVVNEYRTLTGKSISFESNEQFAERYIRWCKSREIDPIGFMIARVYLSNESDYPVPPLRMLASNALATDDAWVAILDRAEALEADRELATAQLQKAEARLFSELSACTPIQEKFRSDHRGSTSICKAELDFSGGYHPKSKFCPLCSEAPSCASSLHEKYGIDVVSLRHEDGYIGYVRVE